MTFIKESNNIHLQEIKFLHKRFYFNYYLISITSGNSIIITGSLLGETGKLINKKKRKISKFFEYSEKEFENILNVESLLPPSLHYLHPIFIKNFISSGKTNLLNTT